MLLIFSKILVVFIYIGIGLAANKKGVLPSESAKYLNRLIMEITIPFLIISSITGRELDDSLRVNTILTLITTAASYVIVACITTFIADRIFKDKNQQDRNVLASAMTGCNSGFMGFPVAQAVFGPLVFYYIVIQNINNNVYLFVLSLLQLHHKDEVSSSGRKLGATLKSLATPASISTIAAVIMLFAGIHLPPYVMDICTQIGDITIPLSMIMVGVQLGGSDFSKVFREKDILISTGIKLIAAPALIMVLMIPLPVDPIVKLATLLGICFPSASLGVVNAAREKMNAQLMAEVVACSTLLSMITLPIWIMICTRLYL